MKSRHMHPSVMLLLLITAAATSQSRALQLPPAAAACPHATGAACIPRERDALLAFKRGITSDPARRLAPWSQAGEEEADCCKWEGVLCSNRTGHVVGLHLGNVQPDDPALDNPGGTALTGQVSPSLTSMHHLESLDLSLNNLSGPAGGGIPEFLGLLKNLRYLDLSGMPLSGMVPPQLGNLSRLHYLDISDADSQVALPWGSTWLKSIDISWLSSLPLQYLDMGSVDLSGVVDWAQVVNTIPSLKVLCLTGCSLTSANQSLPHLNLTNLEELGLFRNIFDHPVASCWFWNLTSLQYLDLVGTFLYGPLPDALGSMTSLQVMDLSNNRFTGPVPSEIGMLNNLVILDLSDNGFTGPVPSEIGMLNYLTDMNLGNNNLSGVITHEHLDGLSRLTMIALSGNSLKIEVDPEWLPTFKLLQAYFRSCHMGPLFPSWLQSQTNIDVLDISSASIFDSLPNWFSTTFSKARELYISNNGINGTLPTNIDNMTSLVKITLDSNQLTGQIPRLPTNLYALDISRNNLSGPLPSNFGAPKLTELYLSSNHITGHVPHSICELNLSNLDLADNLLEGEFPQCSEPRITQTLILSNNMLSGKLDMIFETYMGLQILDLAWNKFTGSIPETITNLGDLIHLNLAGNKIFGSLPQHWSNFREMKANRRQSQIPIEINMSVTTKGQEHYYFDFLLDDMVSIDLSSNHLTGVIPEEITSLDGVVNLNLSRNNLTGKLSKRIGVMKSLESLDLSENKLCGEIPQSLSNLSYLSFMDLSHNNLTGRIPSGGQLDTLYTQDPLMYDGNIGLCGYPLQKNCTTNNREPKHGDQKGDEQDDEVLTFSFGLGIGYVVGLWMVFCLILFNKTWRIAYFCLFDKLFDKVYVYVVVTWASWVKQTATH